MALHESSSRQTQDLSDFDRVESLFAEIEALDPDARQRAIDEALRDRPDLQVTIAALLAAHDRVRPPDRSPDLDDAESTRVGTLIGAFRLTAKIGEGGMGEVFRAERADGLFTQAVAVKLTRSSISHSESRRRFNQERQILASLHHEHIVRLLDGGTTATGQAFLIMEYVEGVPIIAHCRDRALPFEARLTLFMKVCGAVQYAHQHGVVHRDLKPANVLVEGDGVPKVVDFGVAKLLEGEASSGFTSTGMPGPLTPNYASPEQLRGLPVTTASDVYSLGVLLYELVAGVRPYETQGETLERVLAIVVHDQPVRPSAAKAEATALPYARTSLAGDLDAIILKALSKEPADRYGSAHELAADLARHLAGDPVLARAPSTGYLVRRLVGRHKRLAGVAAAALLAILTAAGIAVWQWQVARRAQTRAEQRFNEVRQLANALIFKIHDAVVPLPGSTPVRRTIVDEASGYLERLEAESGGDPAIRLELANAYLRIGDILGNVGAANLGDRAGAITQYEHARSIISGLAAEQLSEDVTEAFVAVNTRLSPQYIQQNDSAGVARAREAVEYATRWLQARPDDHKAQEIAARAYFGLAVALPRDQAIPIWERTLEFYERLLSAQPDDVQTQRNVALVGKYLGAIFESTDGQAALRHYRRSLELDERRLTRAPDDPRVQFDAAISYSNVASVADTLGDRERALRYFAKSLVLRRQLAASDPKNALARSRLGYLLQRIARFHSAHDLDAARAYAAEATAVLEGAFETTKDNSTRVPLAMAWYELGAAEKRRNAPAAACDAFRRASTLFSVPGDSLDAAQTYRKEETAREAAACAGTR